MVRKRAKSVLSPEFKVAAEIYKFNLEEKPIWFTKLAGGLKNDMSSSSVLRALNDLSDWGLVKAQFGETETGRAGRLLFIAGEYRNTIREVYEKFWKNRESPTRD